jgi:hypothetical protein
MKQALINANGHIRLSKKIVLLIQDFVLQDTLILHTGKPNAVREAFSSD